MIRDVITYFHTLRHLKFSQIYGQVVFRLKKPKPNLKPSPEMREHKKLWFLANTKYSRLLTPNIIYLLNESHDISDKDIWQNTKLDKLLLYNLHYFDNLLTNTHQPSQQQLVHRWIRDNPPVKAIAWDPYVISIRVVNWIKWMLTYAIYDELMLNSLAVQIRYLNKRLETHLLANHLFTNAKALIFAGLFFSGKEANKWLTTGLKILNRELSRQILHDGGHFELSPMYHAIILEDILDLTQLFEVYLQPIPIAWMSLTQKMFSWLDAMTHPDGEIAFFNDAAIGIAGTLKTLTDYATKLALTHTTDTQELRYLKESGYVSIKKNNLTLIMDVAEIGASYQPGHAHADTLSFELSLGKHRIFVNSGTSTYAVSDERLRQRGTAAHNTLVVDNTNSSHVWKSFRVAQRAKIINLGVQKHHESIDVHATHNGYAKLDYILHTRCWHLENNLLRIEDEVNGHNQHTIEIYFHLHPDIKIFFETHHVQLLTKDNDLVSIHSDDGFELKDSTYHPQFNKSIANKVLIIKKQLKLPCKTTTTIKWNC